MLCQVAHAYALTEPTRLVLRRNLLRQPLSAAPLSLSAPTTPGPVAAAIPAEDLTKGGIVIFLQNQDPSFGDSTCLDACSHAFSCVWQNAWVWLCHKTNVVDHMWVWESSGVIRSAANDSFSQFPEICLDMCEDYSVGNGACALTAGVGNLNVGWRQCTGAPNQIWMRQGQNVVNAANGQCLQIAVTDCSHFGVCNKYANQTNIPGTMWNAVVAPCVEGTLSQAWNLLPQPGQPLLDYVPLNTSANEYPPPDANVPAEVLANSPKEVILQSRELDNYCLAIENAVSCASINNPDTPVCVWHNVLLQPCAIVTELSSQDLRWVFDNSTGFVMPIGNRLGVQAGLCMTLCSDDSFTNSACSLVGSNVVWEPCTGAANQQWRMEDDGRVLNDAADVCLNMQRFCKISTAWLSSNISIAAEVVDGFPMQNCNLDVQNSAWSQMPYNGSGSTVTGILNVVGGPCVDADGDNMTLLHFDNNFLQSSEDVQAGTQAAIPAPVSPPPQESGGGGSALGAVVGGVVGGVAAVLLAAVLTLAIVRRRRRHARQQQQQQQLPDLDEKPVALGHSDDDDEGLFDTGERRGKAWEANRSKVLKAKGARLGTVEGDLLASGAFTVLASHNTDGELLQADSAEGVDLLDPSWAAFMLPASELEFVKGPDGSRLELGSGAFGTVYKALRNGVQPVAVKVLRNPTEKQLTAFRNEVSILQSLRDNNVVQFLGVCQSCGRIMLVTEFMQGGDLWNALAHTKPGRLDWYSRGRQIALDVARGLVHLHSQNLVHLDLKSPNILLGRDFTGKIADVGLARSVGSDAAGLSLMTAMGTMAWAAPELVSTFRIGALKVPKSAVTDKADVFSFGVVLWEILTGEDPSRTSRAVRVPSDCPQQVADLVTSCVAEDPQQRPEMRTVYEALKFAANLPDPRAPEDQTTDRVGSAYTSATDNSAPNSLSSSRQSSVNAPVSAPLYCPSASASKDGQQSEACAAPEPEQAAEQQGQEQGDDAVSDKAMSEPA
ncbi:hypothetical protein WJX73_004151 [Symbiochloris irregularis]|uniref:Protein kinase domain-containing protein n=1 Tax=Symbiochloris irregularis TaxID=706552 RepID=A0AAW1NVX0_9CHLO